MQGEDTEELLWHRGTNQRYARYNCSNVMGERDLYNCSNVMGERDIEINWDSDRKFIFDFCLEYE
jgi:hypothetical protein